MLVVAVEGPFEGGGCGEEGEGEGEREGAVM